jgi:hypothetical protein
MRAKHPAHPTRLNFITVIIIIIIIIIMVSRKYDSGEIAKYETSCYPLPHTQTHSSANGERGIFLTRMIATIPNLTYS